MNKVWELLPEALQGQIKGLPEGERERIEEVRLRQGRPMSVSLLLFLRNMACMR